MVWKYYKVDGDKLERLRQECPRCKGSFLAEHENRFSCGKCGYATFKKEK